MTAVSLEQNSVMRNQTPSLLNTGFHILRKNEGPNQGAFIFSE